jgi:hypothetical protein
MAHSKGLFAGTCPGSFKPYRKPHEGVQDMRCPRCGHLRQKKVSSCLLFHSYKKRGQSKYGDQREVCQRCGKDRHTQARPCLFFHRWRRTFMDPTLRCTKCGTSQAPPEDQDD